MLAAQADRQLKPRKRHTFSQIRAQAPAYPVRQGVLLNVQWMFVRDDISRSTASLLPLTFLDYTCCARR